MTATVPSVYIMRGCIVFYSKYEKRLIIKRSFDQFIVINTHIHYNILYINDP